LLAADPSALAGLTVTQWLSQTRQPAALREWLWEPLCLAALNTPPSEASAALLATLLQEVLAGSRAGSDLLLPRCNLNALFVDPVARRIRALGSAIELGSPVVDIETSDGRVKAVYTRKRRIPCSQVVLAAGTSAAQKLFHKAGEAKAAERAARLEEKPITTVYLEYPERVRLEAPFVGLVGARTQWLFDRSLPGQEGIIAGVVSADTSPRHHPAWKLGEQTAREVATLYPHWPKPTRVWTVRERRATFTATPASDRSRQPLRTAVEGLWVVGDYTDTGLPGTLEGAVRSGLECAHTLLSSSTTLRDYDAGIQPVITTVP
jgi:glycine/D-amino acid oxidase-like deaminating enzyme